jgi:hypothetical protein
MAAAAVDARLRGGGGGGGASGGGGADMEAAALEVWAEAQQQRLQRLQYCAETGDLPRAGLRHLLLMSGIEFAAKCPRYRAWRLKKAAEAVSRQGGGGGDGEPTEPWPEPQLEVLGALGPYDRL